MLHEYEGLPRGLADGEHPVIVQDHGAVAAKVGNEPLALAKVLRNTFISVIPDRAEEAHCLLRDHSQPALEAGDCHAGTRVNMYRAIDIGAAAKHAAVQRESRTIDAGALVEVRFHIDLH